VKKPSKRKAGISSFQLDGKRRTTSHFKATSREEIGEWVGCSGMKNGRGKGLDRGRSFKGGKRGEKGKILLKLNKRIRFVIMER